MTNKNLSIQNKSVLLRHDSNSAIIKNLLKMTTFQTPSKLKKEITSSFPNKTVKSINGVGLIGRNDLPELKVSNKYVSINTYTPFGGHRSHLLTPPFNVEFL